MKLIDDARLWWRFWSVRLAAIGSALQALLNWWPEACLALWNAMPAEVNALLPDEALTLLPLLFFLAAIAARLVRQPGLDHAPQPERTAA